MKSIVIRFKIFWWGLTFFWQKLCGEFRAHNFYEDWKRKDIPKDEFDSSLNMNHDILLYADDKKKDKYMNELIRRRQIAHERDLEEMDREFGLDKEKPRQFGVSK